VHTSVRTTTSTDQTDDCTRRAMAPRNLIPNRTVTNTSVPDPSRAAVRVHQYKERVDVERLRTCGKHGKGQRHIGINSDVVTIQSIYFGGCGNVSGRNHLMPVGKV